MKRLNDLILKFTSVPYENIIRDVVEENKTEVEDKQIKQLEAGQNPDGSRITPEYSDLTIELKKMKGQPYDKVTLYDTGDFYRGIKLDLASDSFTLDSSDSKTDDLVDKYGDVFGLTNEHKQELINDVFRPNAIDKVRKYLEV